MQKAIKKLITVNLMAIVAITTQAGAMTNLGSNQMGAANPAIHLTSLQETEQMVLQSGFINKVHARQEAVYHINLVAGEEIANLNRSTFEIEYQQPEGEYKLGKEGKLERIGNLDDAKKQVNELEQQLKMFIEEKEETKIQIEKMQKDYEGQIAEIQNQLQSDLGELQTKYDILQQEYVKLRGNQGEVTKKEITLDDLIKVAPEANLKIKDGYDKVTSKDIVTLFNRLLSQTAGAQ